MARCKCSAIGAADRGEFLYFDRSGFCVWGKRLAAGRRISDWRHVRSRELNWTELKLMLEGIEPGRQRKRYRHDLPVNNHAKT